MGIFGLRAHLSCLRCSVVPERGYDMIIRGGKIARAHVAEVEYWNAMHATSAWLARNRSWSSQMP